MITSYEVGAVFRIVDDASPALRRINTEALTLDRTITTARANLARMATVPGLTRMVRQLASVSGELQNITRHGRTAGATVATSLGPMNAELATAVGLAQSLAASLGTAAAASRGLRVPNVAAGAGGRGGRHGPGGLHVSGLSARVPGGHMHIRGGNAAMLGAGALAYGIYQEAEVEDIVARAMITGQLPVDRNMTTTDTFKQMRGVITKNAISGGFSPKEVGEAVLGSERQFAGLPFKERMHVLDTMIPFAMQEARLKETPLKESAEALVGLAHMTGTYDPAKLPDLYRKFAYASQLTPKSLPQYTNALSYSMPSLVAGMGMDPDAIMFMTAMNQAAGIGSSKAGTWIQAFFSRLMPASGINLTRSQSKHNEALVEAGLLDKDLKPTWMVKDAAGKTNWLDSIVKLAPALGDKLSGMEPAARLTWLEGVFGKQGGREAGLMNLPEFVGQFPALARNIKMAQGGDDVLKELTEGSPVQQGRQAWSELTVVLMDLATVVLPPLTAGLKALRDILKDMSGYVPSLGGATKSTGSGALQGAAAGAALGWGIGAFGGPIGMGGGLLIGAGIGAGAGLLGWAASNSKEPDALNPWGDKPAARTVGNALAPAVTGPSQAVGWVGAMAARQGGKTEVTVNATVKAETDNPDGLAQKIARILAQMIANSTPHNTGQGDGALSSPFNSGGDLP